MHEAEPKRRRIQELLNWYWVGAQLGLNYGVNNNYWATYHEDAVVCYRKPFVRVFLPRYARAYGGVSEKVIGELAQSGWSDGAVIAGIGSSFFIK
ncbi:hypothetical protein OK016_10255 [Vibrio chagasii]|nr:hypothetical protein [Vibrio chagasii]